jgi:hypothetical protein
VSLSVAHTLTAALRFYVEVQNVTKQKAEIQIVDLNQVNHSKPNLVGDTLTPAVGT